MSDASPRIVIVERSLQQHASGSITGIIYWQAGGLSFPDDSWDDFVVVILCWWLQAIVRLAERSSSAESLFFMDGPFETKLSLEGGLVRVTFVERRNDEQVNGSLRSTILEVCRAIDSAAASVLRACHTESFHSSEIDELAVEVQRLQQCMATRW
jgi:hypothetical protein